MASVCSLIAAAAALLLVLLTLCAVADVDAPAADAIKLAPSTSTSTASPLVPPRRHHRRRRPVLGPRPVTGVRRNPAASKSDSKPALLSPSHPTDLLSRCRVLWRDATLDHFSGWRPRKSADVDFDDDATIDTKQKRHHRHSGIPETFRQRYFVCDDQWAGPGSPIFFYFGNEADVELYLNATGLMWQSAPAFGAALVFAEHRLVFVERLGEEEMERSRKKKKSGKRKRLTLSTYFSPQKHTKGATANPRSRRCAG